ncbi:MAG TPA: transketolase [Anaeromyxobacter sp.]|nr:transketolase [Anaeromyxobacter sp.]
MSTNRELQEKAITTIRMLAADGVQQANSGHPGMPMGAADMAFVLWTRHLRYDPADPRWLGRDRFVLSGGHGSMLLYSLLHLAGFDCTLDDLKAFRQLHSRTPGHPEFGMLPGVECTTGPLGQGIGNAVGFALGQAMLSAKLGPGNPVEDHFVYAMCGDGDLMEGVAAEAASFAGHNKLGRLVVLYDDNGITIDGKTTVSFSGEDVTKRFEAYGWQVLSADGRDLDGIDRAIAAARAELSRPSLIRVKTVIGFGAPKKAGTSGVHGAPLGEEELAATKKALGWPEAPRFLVPDDVRALWAAAREEKLGQKKAWAAKADAWRRDHADAAKVLDAHVQRAVPPDLLARLAAELPAADSTRKVSGALVQKFASLVPSFVSGSADLFESNNNEVKGGGAVAPGSYGGRNVFYGVREHAMGAIANGLAYDGLFLPTVATFLQFLDYMRSPVRLAALSKLPVTFLYTHDSIFLGEDGPTHQPVEHLTTLRAIPNVEVWRPADPAEVAAAWSAALQRRDGPTSLVLTRQKLAPVKRDGALDPEAILRGGYAVAAPAAASFTLLATGSEVPLAQAALELLAKDGKVGRLVSVPCLERFLAQPQAWRDAIVPRELPVAAVEAALGTEWWRLVGRDGLVIGIERFGESAPEKALAELFGFTPAKVAERVARWLDARR